MVLFDESISVRKFSYHCWCYEIGMDVYPKNKVQHGVSVRVSVSVISRHRNWHYLCGM